MEFDKIYERYKNLLYRIGFTYLKNEHEKRWMIRVTVNLAKKQVRSFWRRNVTNLEGVLESSEGEK